MPPPPPNPPILLVHRHRPPATLTPPPPPHPQRRRLLLARRPAAASPRQADSHLQPGTTRLTSHRSARPSRTHLRRCRQAGARAAVQARKGHPANARAPRPADHRDTGKRRGREGMAAAARRNLRCLRVSAGRVRQQPSRQPGGRRQHRSGLARCRVCHQTPGSSESRPAPSCATKSSTRAQTHRVQVCVRIVRDVLQAVQDFSAPARKVFASPCSHGRHSGATAAVGATRIADGLPPGGRWWGGRA